METKELFTWASAVVGTYTAGLFGYAVRHPAACMDITKALRNIFVGLNLLVGGATVGAWAATRNYSFAPSFKSFVKAPASTLESCWPYFVAQNTFPYLDKLVIASAALLMLLVLTQGINGVAKVTQRHQHASPKDPKTNDPAKAGEGE